MTEVYKVSTATPRLAAPAPHATQRVVLCRDGLVEIPDGDDSWLSACHGCIGCVQAEVAA